MEVTANFEEYYTKYKPLLKKFSFKYYNKFKDFNTLITAEDYFNIAYIGLHKAVLNYKPDRGANFLTYAHFLIEREIRNELFGRSSKEIGNRKLNKKTDSLYERASIENDEFLVIDTLMDDFSFEDVDHNLDVQLAFGKILKAIGKAFNYQEEEDFLDFYYFKLTLNEIAERKGIPEKELSYYLNNLMYRLRNTPIVRKMKITNLEEKIKEIDEKISINTVLDKIKLEEFLKYEQSKV